MMPEQMEQEASTVEESLVPIIDGPVAEILIDGFSTAAWSNDIVKFNLIQTRSALDPNEGPEQVLVARMSMSLSTFAMIFEGFTQLMSELKDDGYFTEGARDAPVTTGEDKA